MHDNWDSSGDALDEDIFLDDSEHYIVFARTAGDFVKGYVKVFDGITRGHEDALDTALEGYSFKSLIRNRRTFLTVNTTSGTIREYTVQLSIEENS